MAAEFTIYLAEPHGSSVGGHLGRCLTAPLLTLLLIAAGVEIVGLAVSLFDVRARLGI